jgi:excisionase family DNA binding protein
VSPKRLGWLSITDYADAYGTSRHTVAKWLAAGLLTSFRVGRHIRIQDEPPAVSKSQELRNTKARAKLGL